MGMYKYVREAWKSPKKNILKNEARERLISWRRGPSTVRIEKPTRLTKARSVGYRAKQGIIVVRQRVMRGGRTRERNIKGKRSKRMTNRLDLTMSYQTVAEQRAAKRFINCEVLNSYYLAEDGKYYWYEIILVDKNHPAIMNDKTLSWISSTKATRRVERGLTASAKKSRGLQNKGKGAEKVRPTQKANKNRLK